MRSVDFKTTSQGLKHHLATPALSKVRGVIIPCVTLLGSRINPAVVVSAVPPPAVEADLISPKPPAITSLAILCPPCLTHQQFQDSLLAEGDFIWRMIQGSPAGSPLFSFRFSVLMPCVLPLYFLNWLHDLRRRRRA